MTDHRDYTETPGCVPTLLTPALAAELLADGTVDVDDAVRKRIHHLRPLSAAIGQFRRETPRSGISAGRWLHRNIRATPETCRSPPSNTFPRYCDSRCAVAQQVGNSCNSRVLFWHTRAQQVSGGRYRLAEPGHFRLPSVDLT
jgi:hypothetical protein